MSFSQKEYENEKFGKLSFSKETIEAVSFEQCRFHECSFIDCKFINCKFLHCQFAACTLSAINPVDSRFSDVKFSNSKVIGFDWTKASHIDDLEFADCQINYTNFRMVKLPKIKLIRCEAREVDFYEADISGGVFKGTDFEKSVFSKTNLAGADFRGARNYAIDASSNVIKKAKFSLPEAMSLLYSLDIIIE